MPVVRVTNKDIAGLQSTLATIKSKTAQMEKMDADIRAKCRDWGLNTYILDSAMNTHDSKQILKAIADLEDSCVQAQTSKSD